MPAEQAFKVFYLLFPYFDFFLQISDFDFKLRMFVLIGLVHHGKWIIVQPLCSIVVVDFDKQAVKLPHMLLCLCQALLIYLHGFLVLQTEFCSISVQKCAS